MQRVPRANREHPWVSECGHLDCIIEEAAPMFNSSWLLINSLNEFAFSIGLRGQLHFR
jgi:hypothetical protein